MEDVLRESTLENVIDRQLVWSGLRALAVTFAKWASTDTSRHLHTWRAEVDRSRARLHISQATAEVGLCLRYKDLQSSLLLLRHAMQRRLLHCTAKAMRNWCRYAQRWALNFRQGLAEECLLEVLHVDQKRLAVSVMVRWHMHLRFPVLLRLLLNWKVGERTEAGQRDSAMIAIAGIMRRWRTERIKAKLIGWKTKARSDKIRSSRATRGPTPRGGIIPAGVSNSSASQQRSPPPSAREKSPASGSHVAIPKLRRSRSPKAAEGVQPRPEDTNKGSTGAVRTSQGTRAGSPGRGGRRSARELRSEN